MTQKYTKKQLQQLKKPELKKIAQEIKDSIKQTTEGISKKTVKELIEFILEYQAMLAEETTETNETNETNKTNETTEIKIPTPKEFFVLISELDTRIEVNAACNKLLTQLKEKNYKTSTISKMLSKYKEYFYQYVSDIEELNELSGDKSHLQHIAANLLSLEEEQISELNENREKSKQKASGFTESGELKKVVLPKKDFLKITKKACQLSIQEKPQTVTSGILPLSGLRKWEQAEKEVIYNETINGKKYPKVLIREWKVVGEYLLAVRGLSKKRGSEDWFVRLTTIPAQKIYDFQERFWKLKGIKEEPKTNQEWNDGNFRKAIDREFSDQWGDTFATIEAYDEKGNLEKNNGSPHKARAFYAWTILSILKSKGASEDQARIYLQKCLAHESETATSRYLRRYSDKDFGAGIDVDFPLNLNSIGLKTNEEIEQLSKEWEEERMLQLKEENEEKMLEVKEENEEREKTLDKLSENFEEKQTQIKEIQFNQDEYIDLLDDDIKTDFAKILTGQQDLTKALALFANELYEKSKPKKTKKESTKNQIEETLAGILLYNAQQPEVDNTVYPSTVLINAVAKKTLKRTFFRETIQKVLEEKDDDIHSRFLRHNVPIGKLRNWNLKHRGSMDEIVDKIVDVIINNQ